MKGGNIYPILYKALMKYEGFMISSHSLTSKELLHPNRLIQTQWVYDHICLVYQTQDMTSYEATKNKELNA